MKYCPECGKVYDDTWKICLVCELELSDNPTIKEAKPEIVPQRELKQMGLSNLGNSLFKVFLNWRYCPSCNGDLAQSMKNNTLYKILGIIDCPFCGKRIMRGKGGVLNTAVPAAKELMIVALLVGIGVIIYVVYNFAKYGLTFKP